MLAKTMGIVLLGVAALWAVQLVAPVLGVLAAAVALVVLGALALGALYAGKRWLGGDSLVGKIAGALALAVGVALAAKAALGAVSGVFGALVLSLEIAGVAALFYVGWRWAQSGEFRLSRRGPCA